MSPTTIRGLILDDQGQPRQGVTVHLFLRPDAAAPHETSTSNSAGLFAFDTVAERGIVSADGYERVTWSASRPDRLAVLHLGSSDFRVDGRVGGLAGRSLRARLVRVFPGLADEPLASVNITARGMFRVDTDMDTRGFRVEVIDSNNDVVLSSSTVPDPRSAEAFELALPVEMPTAWETLETALANHLPSVPTDHAWTAEELNFFAQRAETDTDHVRAYLFAKAAAEEMNLDSGELLFSLALHGRVRSVRDTFRITPAKLAEVMEKAVGASDVLHTSDAALTAFEQARFDAAKAKALADSPLRALIGIDSNLDAIADDIIDVWVRFGAPSQGFFTALENNQNSAVAGRFRRLLALWDLCDQEVDLAGAVFDAVGTWSNDDNLDPLAALTAAQLETLSAEKAFAMERWIEARLPDLYLHNRLAARTEDGDLGDVLTALTTGGFVLDAVLEDGVLSEAATALARALQRVIRILPAYQRDICALVLLEDAGANASAAWFVLRGYLRFLPFIDALVARFDFGVPAGTDRTEEATSLVEQVWSRVVYRNTETVSLVLELDPSAHVPMVVSPQPNVVTDPDDTSWNSLFGPAGVCMCEPCESVLGPPAYFMDLMLFVDNLQGPALADLTQTTSPLRRRPDLPRMLLHCDNANTPLPYIDIVNELLGVAVVEHANQELLDAPVDTTWEAEALRRGPEHPNLKADEVMASIASAHLLPYAPNLDRLRRYSSLLGVDRAAMTTALERAGVRFGTAAPDPSLLEFSQSSSQSYALMTSPSIAQTAPGLWTVPAAEHGHRVSDILERGIVTYAELLAWLQTDLFNPFRILGLSPHGLEDCDLEHTYLSTDAIFGVVPDEVDGSIVVGAGTLWVEGRAYAAENAFKITEADSEQGERFVVVSIADGTSGPVPVVALATAADPVTEAVVARLDIDSSVIGQPDTSVPEAWFRSLFQAARLQRATGWSPSELARVLQAAGATYTNLSNMACRTTLRAARLARTLGLSAQEVATFLAPMALFGDWDGLGGSEASQLEQLLLDPAIIANPPADFERDPQDDSEIMGSAESLTRQAVTLRAVLGLSDGDLAALTLDTNHPLHLRDSVVVDGVSVPSLSRDNLSQIARTAYLAAGLQITVAELHVWADMAGASVFDSPTTTYPSDAADRAEALRETESFVESLSTVLSLNIHPSEMRAALFGTHGHDLGLHATTLATLVDEVRLANEDGTAGAMAEVFMPRTRLDEARMLHILQQADLTDALRSGDDAAVEVAIQSLTRALRVGEWLDLTLAQLEQSADNDDWRLHPADVLTSSTNLFQRFIATRNLARTAPAAPDDLGGTWAVVTEALGATGTGALVSLTGIEFSEFQALFDSPPATARFAQASGGQELTMWHALREVAAEVGTDVAALVRWLTTVDDAGEAASEVLAQVQVGRPASVWGDAVTEIHDHIRVARRDAMVEILQVHAGFRSEAELHAHFLVDVGMSPCMMISRLKLALSSVQLFIQRVNLNLEAGLSLPPQARQEWSWMQQYRVWEANRKVLLYPENWLEPEVRDDKSELFEAFEARLAQAPMSESLVKEALLDYLRGLSRVAVPLVVSHFFIRAPRAIGQEEDIGELHVVARTVDQPQQLMYRKQHMDQTWTPWETIDLAIDSPNAALMVWRGRVFLFWTTADQSSLEFIIDDETTVRETVYQHHVHWSERVDGVWTEPIRSRNEVTTLAHADLAAMRLELVPSANGNDSAPYNEQFAPAHRGHGVYALVYYSEPSVLVEPHVDPKLARLIEAYDNILAALSQVPGVDPGKVAEIENLRATAVNRQDMLTALHSTHYRFEVEWTPDAEHIRFRDNSATITPDDEHPISSGGIVAGWKNHGFEIADPEHRRIVLTRHEQSYGNEYTVVQRHLPNTRARITPASETERERSMRRFFMWDGSYNIEFRAPRADSYDSYRTRAHFHPVAQDMLREVIHHGPAGLYDPEGVGGDTAWIRQRPTEIRDYFDGFPYAEGTNPLTSTAANQGYQPVEFRSSQPYGLYNWELFFHIPMLVSKRMQEQGAFAEAQQWLHAVFDPALDGRWRVRPLADIAAGQQTLVDALRRPAADDDALAEHASEVAAWRRQPFSPHVIARMRPVTYQKYAVIQYIELLLEWADVRFRRDSIESLNEATQLYLMAHELLGERPTPVISLARAGSTDFETLTANSVGRDRLGQSLVEIESILFGNPGAERMLADPKTAAAPSQRSMMYFCVPGNEHLIDLWDQVEDRMFKIRNCLDIDGNRRELPLYEPPLDPGMLINRPAGSSYLSAGVPAVRPTHRFSLVIESATAALNDARGMSTTLLSLRERWDAEELTSISLDHEQALHALQRKARLDRITEAAAALDGLRRTRSSTESRLRFYRGRPRRSSGEETQLESIRRAIMLRRQSAGLNSAGAILTAIGSVGTSVQTGPYFVGQSLLQVASTISMGADAESTRGTIAGMESGYTIRHQDWQFAADQAEQELETLDAQLEAAELRVQLAENELAMHDRQVQQHEERRRFFEDKYTNQQLYTWMQGRLMSTCRRFFELVHTLARESEAAMQLELGVVSTIIQPLHAYWSNDHDGHTANELMALHLRQLRQAYRDADVRRFELTKDISLRRLSPVALHAFREGAEARFTLDDALFDLDYPGHTDRRLASVAVTVACSRGPHTTVPAILTLVNAAEQPVNQSIALSSGLHDAGIFEANDGRYMPFEHQALPSEWSLRRPDGGQFPFDPQDISDVVLHLRYRARPGAETHVAVPDAFSDLGQPIAIDLRRDLPDLWHTWVEQGGDISVPLDERWLPYGTTRFDIGHIATFSPGDTPTEPTELLVSWSGGTQQLQVTPAAGATDALVVLFGATTP